MVQLYGSSQNNSVVDISEKVGIKGFFIIQSAAYAIWLLPLVLILTPLVLCSARRGKRKKCE